MISSIIHALRRNMLSTMFSRAGNKGDDISTRPPPLQNISCICACSVPTQWCILFFFPQSHPPPPPNHPKAGHRYDLSTSEGRDLERRRGNWRLFCVRVYMREVWQSQTKTTKLLPRFFSHRIERNKIFICCLLIWSGLLFSLSNLISLFFNNYF